MHLVGFTVEISSQTLSLKSFKTLLHIHSKVMVPKLCFADPKESATSSQEIRGYISVMATLNVTCI